MNNPMNETINKPIKNPQDDALIMVHLRNEFYKKKFYLALVTYLLSFIAIIVLSWVLIDLIKNPTKPLYFVTDKEGRLIQDLPRSVPNMSTEEVMNWTIDAIETAYSYDYVNYRLQFQNSQKYFTEYGWQSYMKGLKTSNNLLALTQRKYVVIAKVVEKPKLLVEGILGGAYAWKFQLPLLVTYLSPPFDEKAQFSNPILLTVVVQRQSILVSYKGLAIMQMIGNLVYSAPQQNLNVAPAAGASGTE